MINNNTYNLDVKKLGMQTMFEHWRKVRHTAWIKALLQQLAALYALFLNYRNAQRYRLQITPQVCYLEKALNDRYDTNDRRIYIDEPPEQLPLILFRKSEAKRQTLSRKSEETEPKVLYRKNETSAFSVDFIVVMPLALIGTDLAELRAFIDTYKLVTKTYAVQFL